MSIDDRNYYLEIMLEKMLELGMRPTKRQIEKDRMFNVQQLKKVFNSGTWYYELVSGAEKNLAAEGYEVDKEGVVLKDGTPINKKIAKKRERELKDEIRNLAAELVEAGVASDISESVGIGMTPEIPEREEKQERGEIAMRRRNWSREKVEELLREFYGEHSRIPTYEEIGKMEDWPSKSIVIKFLGLQPEWYKALGLPVPEKSVQTKTTEVKSKEAAKPIETTQPVTRADLCIIIDAGSSDSANEFLVRLLKADVLPGLDTQVDVVIRIP